MDPSPLTPSTGPQIRSRITVVCAECKRLKLKCDRRTPCGSCTKRDTVARCIYSPAAAEKVDLHSLNNRLLQVEATLSQLTAGASSSTHNNPYSNAPSNPHNYHPILAGSPLAISIQDIISIWLDELDINQSILPTPTHLSAYTSPPSFNVKLEPSPISVPPDRHILDKASDFVPSPTLTLPSPSIYHLPPPSLHLPYSAHASPSSTQQPQITPRLLDLLPPLSTLDALDPLMAIHPCFNWRHFKDRVRRMPKSTADADGPGGQEREMARERSKSGDKNTKADTARAIFFGPPHPASRTPVFPPSSKDGDTHRDKERDRDRDKSLTDLSSTSEPTISFFAAAAAAFALGALVSSSGPGPGEAPTPAGQSNTAMPMIIDFVDDAPGATSGNGKKKKVKTKQPVPPRLSTSSSTSPSTSKASVRRPSMHVSASSPSLESGPDLGSTSPAFLFALSMQAQSVHEMNAHFDLDYLVACVLQLLYLLHGGRGEGRSGETECGGDGEPSGLGNGKGKGKAKGRETLCNAIFPLVGKMVNIARQMGLGTDPDEFPGGYSIFEAETRRRIWWDVYYYDLFVSDCMGHPPLIQDGSFTTKLPADADEDAFSPASMNVPVPVPMRSAGVDGVVDGWCPTGFKYFELKCRLARLVKTMKRRTSKDPLSDPRELAYTIEQAAGFEADVRQWLAALPQPFWLDMNAADGFGAAGDGNEMLPLMSTPPSFVSPSSATTTSPILVAHQCELAITANRLILKLYIPFLRPGAYNNVFPPHQASHGTVNAAHMIIHASKVLYSAWKQHQHQQQHSNADAPETMLTLTPAMFGFYSFGRTLFDAAVVCAHAAIKQPTSVWAVVALADVGAALEVMRDPIVASAGAVGMCGEYGEVVRVVEMMQKKAEAARSGGVANARMKRKHDEVDGRVESLAALRLPYLGSAPTPVSGRGSPVHQRQQHLQHSEFVNVNVPCSNPRPKFETTQKAAPNTPAVTESGGEGGERAHSGKHVKKTQYPSVGIRVRPGKEGSPLVRDRNRSSSTTTTTTTTTSNEGRMYAPAPPPPQNLPAASTPRGPHTSQPRTPDSGYHRPHHHSHRSTSLQQDSNQDMYRHSPLNQDIPMQPDVMTQPAGADLSGVVEYSIPFGGGGDDVQMDVKNMPRRRFSIHELEQSHQHQHQQQQQTFPTNNSPTFDQRCPGNFDQPPRSAFDSDSRGSFDRSCVDSYVPASSPYASRPETGSSSGPISSASSPYASTGAGPSSLSTPTFGQHPSPPAFGHQLHASPASYAPSPLANPTSHSFYVANGFETQYNNGGMPLVGLGVDDHGNNGNNMVSVVDTPLYEKSHPIMYDAKSSDLGNGTLQQPFQIDHGHVQSQNHGISALVSPQTWPQENETGPQGSGEYWGAYKFY